MNYDVIILAGGLGTRLRSVIGEVPKPMALIGDKPFLEYLLDFLNKANVNKIIISVGYKKEDIIDYFGNKYKNIEIIYAEEEQPLGTGGAVLNAIKFVKNDKFFIFNGDTFFEVDLNEMIRFSEKKQADILVALKKLKNAERYGKVKIDEDFKIIEFIEKGSKQEGYINGGVYLVNKTMFEKLTLPKVFSFEKDFLEKYYKDFRFYGLAFDSYFIDIGVPEDYERAKIEIAKSR